MDNKSANIISWERICTSKSKGGLDSEGGAQQYGSSGETSLEIG